MVFGVRLPRALSSTFIRQALQASEGIPGLSAAMRGLVAARAAVLAAVVAIDGDIRKMARASGPCRRLMSIPGVEGQLKLKAWALAIAKRSTMRKARIALARRLAIIMHAMLRYGTEFKAGLAEQHLAGQEIG